MPKSPFQTAIHNGSISLTQSTNIEYVDAPHVRLATYVKGGIGIAYKNIRPERKIAGLEETIIRTIHEERHAQTNPYIISGGHFRQLYVRNLGIFNNALLDVRLETNPDDWVNRQCIALRTIALVLAIFNRAGKDFTTIVPLGKNRFTALNIYARPSDALYSVLYTLRAMLDPTAIPRLYPSSAPGVYELMTQAAAGELLKQYRDVLGSIIRAYYSELIDPANLLVRKDLLLSGVRDGIKRRSSFYDNVIAWATMKLADELGLYSNVGSDLAAWKQRIIAAYWDNKKHMFVDEPLKLVDVDNAFSADCLITLQTGFLKPEDVDDRRYLEGIILYVQQHQLDQPLPLRYAHLDSPRKLYRPVLYTARSYMGKSIWSHWGMEYIKLMILLGPYNMHYLDQGRHYLDMYQERIEKYGGYPELYHLNAKLFKTSIYRSVLRTSWIINYEQAKMLLAAA